MAVSQSVRQSVNRAVSQLVYEHQDYNKKDVMISQSACAGKDGVKTDG